MIGPFLDRYVVDAWVFQYDWRTAAMVCLGFSCALAVGVNLSQFACLGRFSAVSFQVSRLCLRVQRCLMGKCDPLQPVAASIGTAIGLKAHTKGLATFSCG